MPLKLNNLFKKRYTLHAGLIGLMAVTSVQNDTVISGRDNLFSSLLAGEEVVEGPLDPSRYTQDNAPGIGGVRLAAAEGSLGLDLITMEDPEVIAPLMLNENVVIAPLSPIMVEPNASPAPSTPSIRLYDVQEGDTVGTIANRFNVSEETLLWANGLGKNDVLKVGDQLTILPVTGILHTVKTGDTLSAIARHYQAKVSDITGYNHLDQGGVLALGAKIIIPDGQKPAPAPTPQPATAGTTRLATPTTTPAPIKTTVVGMIRPVKGYVSQNFGGRWRHSGVDVAGNAGETIYAATAGQVVFSGWRGGYGQMVIVDHGSGVQTLYAHTSANYVKVGQSVNKGDAIAKVGSTGRSTGYHLHFEVIKDGRRLNPCNLISC